ncbi:MAG: (2Fe-2S)-binding protein [Planctomycetes bacterium]|nr:(2Fe-2S)-binding protein [Planctomycetota bacterium]
MSNASVHANRPSSLTITIDGREVNAVRGQTILEAAEAAGVWIPRLCHFPGLEEFGGCRVCVVVANGRSCASCTQPVAPGMVVENETEQVLETRRAIIEMLLVEGNHFCMFCEKSGRCELQALAYRLGITASRFDALWPKREVDASHPDVLIDRNRCILCSRCVRASRDFDGKHVFHFAGRGAHKRIVVNSSGSLADTSVASADRALEVCPVGSILPKRRGYDVPVGARTFDVAPIGAGTERARPEESR